VGSIAIKKSATAIEGQDLSRQFGNKEFDILLESVFIKIPFFCHHIIDSRRTAWQFFEILFARKAYIVLKRRLASPAKCRRKKRCVCDLNCFECMWSMF
jgi:hypothetical protein